MRSSLCFSPKALQPQDDASWSSLPLTEVCSERTMKLCSALSDKTHVFSLAFKGWYNLTLLATSTSCIYYVGEIRTVTMVIFECTMYLICIDSFLVISSDTDVLNVSSAGSCLHLFLDWPYVVWCDAHFCTVLVISGNDSFLSSLLNEGHRVSTLMHVAAATDEMPIRWHFSTYVLVWLQLKMRYPANSDG